MDEPSAVTDHPSSPHWTVELGQIAFNVAIAIVAFVGGAAIQGALDLGVWFTPVSMLPVLLWFNWRLPLPQGFTVQILASVVFSSAYLAVKTALFPNAPDWMIYIEALILAIFWECTGVVADWWSGGSKISNQDST